MLSFHKNLDCPTSQELLAYQNDDLTAKKRNFIGEHLCACDFCGAEAEFYARFPYPGSDNISVGEIPPHLYELAEALLNNKDKGTSLIDRLVRHRKGISR